MTRRRPERPRPALLARRLWRGPDVRRRQPLLVRARVRMDPLRVFRGRCRRLEQRVLSSAKCPPHSPERNIATAEDRQAIDRARGRVPPHRPARPQRLAAGRRHGDGCPQGVGSQMADERPATERPATDSDSSSLALAEGPEEATQETLDEIRAEAEAAAGGSDEREFGRLGRPFNRQVAVLHRLPRCFWRRRRVRGRLSGRVRGADPGPDRARVLHRGRTRAGGPLAVPPRPPRAGSRSRSSCSRRSGSWSASSPPRSR